MGHVEADGRLVEEEDLRLVQKRGGHFALHALAKERLRTGLSRRASKSSSAVNSSTVC